MSLSGAFDTQAAAKPPIKPKRTKREKPPSPFSLRLSAEERARLAVEAAGAPLGTYVKAKLLGQPIPARARAEAIAAARLRAMLDANPSGQLGDAQLNDFEALKRSGLL